jgi:hypothetical protein
MMLRKFIYHKHRRFSCKIAGFASCCTKKKTSILFLISKTVFDFFGFCRYGSKTEFSLMQWNFLVSRNFDNCFVSTSLLQKAPCNGGGGGGWEGTGLNVQNEMAKLHISKWIGGIFKIVSVWYQQLYSGNAYLLCEHCWTL